jgi:hypothetical protein
LGERKIAVYLRLGAVVVMVMLVTLETTTMMAMMAVGKTLQ